VQAVVVEEELMDRWIRFLEEPEPEPAVAAGIMVVGTRPLLIPLFLR
jgi:hypothetical protein